MHLTGLRQSLAPADEPVTVAELRAQCRIDADIADEDTQLLLYITAARQAVEQETGRQLLRATYQYGTSGFPSGQNDVILPMPPLLRVVSVQYVDSAGATQTMPTTDYVADTLSLPGAVSLAYGLSWPSTREQRNAVTITYQAGYGDDAEQVPQPLKMAVLLWAATLYEQREATVEKAMACMPLGVDRLLNPYRTAAVLIG